MRRAAPAGPLWGAAAALAVTTVVAVYGLRESLATGRLSAPPTYDDVAYLLSSEAALRAFPHLSLGGKVWQIVHQHAPLSTMLGVIGYLAVPEGDIGPYIANSIVLLVYLLGCVVALRRLPAIAIVGVVAAIGALPFIDWSITEFRPDLAWGFSTGLAAVSLLTRNLFAASVPRLVGIGLLAGFALISKPPTCPATASILATAFAGSVVLHRIAGDARIRWRSVIRAGAVLAVSALALAGPVYAVIGPNVVHYIRFVLVDLHDQFALGGGFLFHLLFYASATGGGRAFGYGLWLIGVFWVAVVAYAIAFDRRLLARGLAYGLIVLVAYAIPTVLAMKSYFLGGAFYGVLVTATVALLAELWPSLDGWRTRYAAGALCAGGVAVLLWTNILTPPAILTRYDPSVRQDHRDGAARVWSILRQHAEARSHDTPPGTIYRALVLSPEPISADLISLYGLQRGVPILGISRYYTRNVDELISPLANNDYVVVTDSADTQLTGPRLGNAFKAIMAARDDFALVGTYARTNGGTVEVYEKRR